MPRDNASIPSAPLPANKSRPMPETSCKLLNHMRVISGIHKSKALESLEGRNTRPTMDKVKEGIFNSLHEVSGIGLDLFAGSGALGIRSSIASF
jgi:hypothetical protein